MTTPLERVLGALPSARQRGGQWLARCPAHADKTPSLHIGEKPDGVVVLHCFAGCEPSEVVAAIGLELADLFPAPPLHAPGGSHRREIVRRPSRLSPLDALRLLQREASIIVLAGLRLRDTQPLSDDDRARLLTAMRLIDAIVFGEGAS